MIRLFRRHRRRYFAKARAAVLADGRPGAMRRLHRSALISIGWIAAIVATHATAMMALEGMKFGDALWLTATSVTTVGYGDLSAATPMGRLATTLIIYVGGIFLCGKIAGDFFDYRATRREMMKRGKWSWDQLDGHIVLIGAGADSKHHLTRLVGEFEQHEATQGREIVLVSESFPDGLPTALENLEVKYVQGPGTNPETLARAAMAKARVVIALAADPGDALSDGRSFDLIHRAREANPDCMLVAECVDDNNRERMEKAGASLVIRPARAYPEMIVGALLNPGVHIIFENLFTAQGESIRLDETPAEGRWGGIVTEYVAQDRGIPIAYRDQGTGAVVTAPNAEAMVKADALFLLKE